MTQTMQATLRALNTALQGQEFILAGRTVIIGRTKTCDVLLDQISISRKHARIEQVGGGFTVYDLGSRNGIKVNGIVLSQSELRPDDVVHIGEVQLRFDLEPVPPAAQPAPTPPAETTPPPPSTAEAEARPLTTMDIMTAAQRGGPAGATAADAALEVDAEAIEDEPQTGPVARVNYRFTFAVMLGLVLAVAAIFVGMSLFGGKQVGRRGKTTVLLRVGDRKWVGCPPEYGAIRDDAILIDDDSIADIQRFKDEASELIVVGRTGGATTARITTERGNQIEVRIVVRGRAPRPYEELTRERMLPQDRLRLAAAFLRNGRIIEEQKPYLALQEYRKAQAVLDNRSTNKGRLSLEAKHRAARARQKVEVRWDKLIGEHRLTEQNKQWALCVDLMDQGLALITNRDDPRNQKCVHKRWDAIEAMRKANRNAGRGR